MSRPSVESSDDVIMSLGKHGRISQTRAPIRGTINFKYKPSENKRETQGHLQKMFKSRPKETDLIQKDIKQLIIFGVNLQYENAAIQECITHLITCLIELIEANALDVEGIYRVSADMKQMQKLRLQNVVWCHGYLIRNLG